MDTNVFPPPEYAISALSWIYTANYIPPASLLPILSLSLDHIIVGKRLLCFDTCIFRLIKIYLFQIYCSMYDYVLVKDRYLRD